MIKLTEVTRLEIIDESGRTFGRFDLDGVSLSSQDEGRTLKVFLDYDGEQANRTITVLQAVAWQLENEDGGREVAVEMIRDHLDELMGGDDER